MTPPLLLVMTTPVSPRTPVAAPVPVALAVMLPVLAVTVAVVQV